MPTTPLVVDFGDAQIAAKVAALQPTPGLCVFIDIVGSTAMKQGSLENWVALIGNAFSFSTAFIGRFKPLKGIGDELMYFIEDADLAATGESPLQIYDALFQIAGSGSTSIPPTKIVASHCSNVFAMTFLQGSNDYYGVDVDRAARLKLVKPPLQEGEVIVDDAFYAQIQACYHATGNKWQFPSFDKLRGPYTVNAKGIPTPLRFYRAMA